MSTHDLDNRPFVPRVWMAVVVILSVGTLLIVGVLRSNPAQEAVDNTRNAATRDTEYAPVRRLTPDLAVVFVQNEFPYRFPNAEQLTKLFAANCRLLELGQTYNDTVQGMVNSRLTAEESVYIMNMSIYSTCPNHS